VTWPIGFIPPIAKARYSEALNNKPDANLNPTNYYLKHTSLNCLPYNPNPNPNNPNSNRHYSGPFL